MLSFGDVAVVVSDAKKAAAWWRGKIGLEVRDDDGHWVTVAAKESDTLIHLCESKPLEKGNTGIGFLAKDVLKAAKETRSEGRQVHEARAEDLVGRVRDVRGPGRERILDQRGMTAAFVATASP